MLLPLIIGLVTIAGLGVGSYCEVAGCFTPITPESVSQAVGASGVQRIEVRLVGGDTVRVPMVDGGAPAPDAPSTSPPVSGGTPGASPAEGSYCQRASDPTSTGGVVELCTECIVNYQPLVDGRMCRGMVYEAGVGYSPSGVNYDNASMAASPPVCGDGYAASGSECVLSDARLAVSDGKYDLKRDAGGFSGQPEADTKPSNVDINNGQGVIYGTDSEGRPTISTFSSDGAGGTRIVTQTQIDSGGQSYVQTDTVSVNGGGVVTGVSSNTQTGSISAGDGGPGTVTTGGDADKVVFPSDYARKGEAAAAAASINEKLDELHDDLTKPGEAPADLIAPDASEFEQGFFKGTFSSLLEWDLPAHTSTCPTAAINFDFFGQPFNVNMNAQCLILADETVSNTAQTAFVVLWILVALFIVLGA